MHKRLPNKTAFYYEWRKENPVLSMGVLGLIIVSHFRWETIVWTNLFNIKGVSLTKDQAKRELHLPKNVKIEFFFEGINLIKLLVIVL